MKFDWAKVLGPKRLAVGKYWTRSLYLVHGCKPHIYPDRPSGCQHCWSAGVTHRFRESKYPWQRKIFGGLTENVPGSGPRFNGAIRLMESYIQRPIMEKEPQVYAVWNDLFGDDVPFEYMAWAFSMMRLCHWHVFLVVTKNPGRAREFFNFCDPAGFKLGDIPNVIGIVTAETQWHLDQRAPVFLECPFAVHGLSIEPQLGPVDITLYSPHIGWVILGGESGHYARPMHPDWPRRVHDDCESQGIPYFFKQWGEWSPIGMVNDKRVVIGENGKTWDRGLDSMPRMYRTGRKKAGRMLDGQTWDEFPEIKMEESI
jgi:protein gp37